MPANILNLPQYRVLSVEETDQDYHIAAEPVEPTRQCPHCGSSRFQGWGGAEQPRLIKDLPMHGKRVGIYIDPKRFRCQAPDCLKTFFTPLPVVAENRQMTERLVKWISQQSLKRTFLSLADETGVDEKTVRNIFRDYISDLESKVTFETPKWMGIDEIHLIKPRCVITNIENNTVVDMLVNRNRDTVIKYLYQLKGKEQIEYVAMDLWQPYRDAVKTVLPDARIVIDKFHVVKMANEAIEKVRKALRAELTPKQRRGLMHDRFILLKRERDLTPKEAFNLDGWTKNYPALGLAYRLKEDFYGIYEAKTQQQAQARYEAWYRCVTPDIYEHFSDLIRAWTNWQPYILRFFENPITNAYTESLNNLIRCTDRAGRGYSWEALRVKILFTEGLHKKQFIQQKFECRRPEPVMEQSVGFFVPGGAIGHGLPPGAIGKAKMQNQQNGQGQEVNYGVDISTLVRIIEAGEI